VAIEKATPATISKNYGTLGRSHDVSEEDRRQRAIGISNRGRAGQELLNLIEYLVFGSVKIEKSEPST
jgi:hypothetical protein